MSPASSLSPSTFNFLTLPAELRVQIYDIVLRLPPAVSIHANISNEPPKIFVEAPDRQVFASLTSAILATCHQIAHEATSILYDTRFFFPFKQPLELFLSEIGPRNVRRLRHIMVLSSSLPASLSQAINLQELTTFGHHYGQYNADMGLYAKRLNIWPCVDWIQAYGPWLNAMAASRKSQVRALKVLRIRQIENFTREMELEDILDNKTETEVEHLVSVTGRSVNTCFQTLLRCGPDTTLALNELKDSHVGRAGIYHPRLFPLDEPETLTENELNHTAEVVRTMTTVLKQNLI